ncbi:MAG: Type II secretion system protein E (GspE) [Candidatus Woesebacteria bacterium GW2011_GWA1_39_21]|uniref:Type II secretion system protein E (GspE) n=1 Tax=Candidatus Woesebacteria bacterium GW2011_GWA1_39_21 TaxID=1618550 RepID=A0A0G0RDC5_9BACT|nr:MAG: Type II secretion system protein E (GspE) [Candidatus Woesebacteria bacterium GW2011_GWA1_39_21]
MLISPEKLKKILVGSGYVKEPDFDDALKSSQDQGRDVSDVLIFRGLISEDALGKIISEYLNIPYADVRRLFISTEILNLIPEKLARTYRMIPFEAKDKKIKLAMENPEDFEAIEFVKRQTGCEIEPYFARSEDISKALGQYKKNLKSDFEKIISENVKKVAPGESLEKAAEDVPVVKILNTISEYAVALRASDIHIESQAESVVIRFRIDGVLRDMFKFQKGIEEALVARIKILSNLKIDEHRIPQDGRHKFNVDDEAIALRISIIPGFYGENVVMRILRETNRPLSLEELGITGHGLMILRENCMKPHGMILVTGPTGSGKTTTLYSIMNILNTAEVKMCTIEDPIEYGMNRVTQIQVNSKTGLTFAAGLRALMRHDPDNIMVGEIRDEETAEIAIHAALTGHLVLSTLHTNTAAGAVPRLLDMGAAAFLLASTLNVVVAQRLVRKICPSCITKYTPDESIVKKISKELGDGYDKLKFYKGKGCNDCNHKGYLGRVGIYEIMPITEKLRQIIVQKPTTEQLFKEAVSEGMITMMRDGMDKIAAGLTTIEEVFRVANEE